MSGLDKIWSHPGRPADEEDDAPDGQEGRSSKFQAYGLKLIWPGPGKSRKATTVLYGSIVSEIEFDRDPEGECVITFEYDAGGKAKRVKVRGREIEDVHDYISQGRRATLVAQGRVHGIVVEEVG